MMTTQTIRCDCESIELNVFGKPMARGICHCPSCQSLYNAAFHAGAVWPENALTITLGQAFIKEYKLPDKELRRYWCEKCGAIVFNTNRFGYVVIPQARLRKANGGMLLPEFAPQVHLFYASRIMNIDDHLPKFLAGTDGPLFES